MIERYLDMHSWWCKTDHYHNDCCTNPERIILFIKNDFYLIAYHKCVAPDKITFIQDLLELIIKKYKIYDIYDIYRGWEVEKGFREFRIRNQNLRKYVLEVNYHYSNAAKKEYVIATKTKLIDAICNVELQYNNYKIAKEYLEKNNYYFLLNDLEKLSNLNTYYLSDYECHKTIEHLIEAINKNTQTNGNHKKSKHKRITSSCVQHNDVAEI